jgi:hypothetical protein
MRGVINSIVAALLLILPSDSSAQSTEIRREVTLSHLDKTITAVRIRNTASQSYTAPGTNQVCDVRDSGQLVIWSVVAEGANMQGDGIALSDERNRKFQYVCWSVYWTGVKARSPAGDSWMLFAGPTDSKRITVTFGTASAEIDVSGKRPDR